MGIVGLNRAEADERMNRHIGELGFSARVEGYLTEKGIVTVWDLLHRTREDLMSIAGFGETSIAEVYKRLEGIGFYRKGMEPPPPPESVQVSKKTNGRVRKVLEAKSSSENGSANKKPTQTNGKPKNKKKGK